MKIGPHGPNHNGVKHFHLLTKKLQYITQQVSGWVFIKIQALRYPLEPGTFSLQPHRPVCVYCFFYSLTG